MISSVQSEHSNADEDRKWNFETCTLVYIGSDVELFDSNDDNCPTNEYDEQQECYCGKGRKISELSSVHDNGKQDRQYDFTCTDIDGYDDGSTGDSW